MSMEKNSKTNNRTCIVNRKQYPKNELIRIVKNKYGKIFIDDSYKADGRGGYILKNPKSIKIAIDKGKLKRALRTKEIPEEVIYELKNRGK